MHVAACNPHIYDVYSYWMLFVIDNLTIVNTFHGNNYMYSSCTRNSFDTNFYENDGPYIVYISWKFNIGEILRIWE